MSSAQQVARSSTGEKAPRRQLAEPPTKWQVFAEEAAKGLIRVTEDLQRTLSPRADSPGSSPFEGLAPWLRVQLDQLDPATSSSGRRGKNFKEWPEARRRAPSDQDEWAPFEQALSQIFGEFKDPEHGQRLALAGIYGIKLVLNALQSFRWDAQGSSEVQFRFICDYLQGSIQRQIDRQKRRQDSFISLLPPEVLAMVLRFAGVNHRSKVALAVVHKSWCNIARSLIWHSITVKLYHDHVVEAFARIAQEQVQNANYSTRFMYIETPANLGAQAGSVDVGPAVLAVKGLRELTLVDALVSMSVFENPSMAELSDLTLHLVDLRGPLRKSTLDLTFHLRSLSITNIESSEDHTSTLLAAIAATSSSNLKRLTALTLDSAGAARQHLSAFSSTLIELSLKEGDSPYNLSTLDPTSLDFSALRKLSLPLAELSALLALPPAGAPPDAPRCTISQAIPGLENLVVLCASRFLNQDDVSNLVRLLRLPVCEALRTLDLEDADFDDDVEWDEFVNTAEDAFPRRGLEITVNGESLSDPEASLKESSDSQLDESSDESVW